jgi:hypothetical protein
MQEKNMRSCERSSQTWVLWEESRENLAGPSDLIISGQHEMLGAQSAGARRKVIKGEVKCG